MRVSRTEDLERSVPGARSIADEVSRKVAVCDDAELETLLSATRAALAAQGREAGELAEALLVNAPVSHEAVGRVITTEKRLRYYVRLKEVLRRLRRSSRPDEELALLGVRR